MSVAKLSVTEMSVAEMSYIHLPHGLSATIIRYHWSIRLVHVYMEVEKALDINTSEPFKRLS